MTKKNYFSLILVLGSLVALGPFSIDMYLPGFKTIAADLHTSEARVGWSLSSYFIGLSAGQLLYGPLLDRFGRKKPLYAGLLVYILASAGCVLVKDIDIFIGLRFIQALGGCAAAVAAIAMVRDLFPVSENAKVFALLMLVLGVSPMIAPTLGGYITVAWGWQTVFLVLLLLGLSNLVASWLWLPEKYKADRSISLKPRPIISGFLTVLREPRFHTNAIAGALAFAGLFVYVTSSPVLFMSIYDVGEKVYGWIFALLSIGFVGGSQLNTLLLRRFKSEQLIFAALSGQVLSATVFLAGSLAGWFGLAPTIIFLFIFLTCLGVVNPNAAALSMAPFSRNAGSASSVMGAMQMGFGAFASACIGFFEQHSALPMASIMLLSSFLGLAMLLFGRSVAARSLPERQGHSADDYVP